MSEQLVLDLGHRPAHGAEDFLVAPCNRDAVAWLDRWPDWPGPTLAVYGPAGCGKTHLAHVWMARSKARFLTADGFRESLPDALVEDSKCLILDGACSGQDERKLLHLYNMVAEARGSLLITSRTPPTRWAIELADLRSRLAAAPAVAIGHPDDGLIAAVMVKLFADRQVSIDGDVLAYMLPRMERSFAAARSLVAALDRSALSSRRKITVSLAREVMANLDELNRGA